MQSQSLDQYVRQINNQSFLSQHQLNSLYVMLLLRQPSPWDSILPASDIKNKIKAVINHKISQIHRHLHLLLTAYDQKIKNKQIARIQKFTSILRAKQKSMYIYIRKQKHFHLNSTQQNHIQQKQQHKNNLELAKVLHGISDISSLGIQGLDNIVEQNNSERYITFEIGSKYNFTIKNDDPVSRDTTSSLSLLPKEILIHQIMTYFPAYQLFKLRSVCKQWQEYVKDAWHNCFKRQMYSQLLASQLCRQIQFFYKLLQLRNPFYQKLVLLLHALIQLISWDSLKQSIQNDTLPMSLKRILLVLLMLLGDRIPISNFNSITETVWLTNKERALNLKQKIVQYFSNLTNTVLSINEVKEIKLNFLDNPFMRIQEMNEDDKTPLLLYIFMKQFALQSILKNHILLTQQYLGFARNKLDGLYHNWSSNQKFLQTAYKIILLKGRQTENSQVVTAEKTSNYDYGTLFKSVFENNHEQFSAPVFTITGQSTVTNVYLDNRTRWDIFVDIMRRTESEWNQTQSTQNLQKQVQGGLVKQQATKLSSQWVPKEEQKVRQDSKQSTSIQAQELEIEKSVKINMGLEKPEGQQN